MTVAELMKCLTRLPLEAEVYVEGADRSELPATEAVLWKPDEDTPPPYCVLITSHDYPLNVPG